MRVRLLNEHKECNLPKLTEIEHNTIKDLGLEVVFTKMANGNKILYDYLKSLLFMFECSKEVIEYRQEILKDILDNKETTIEIFDIIDKLSYEITTHYMGIIELSPYAVVSSSIYLLELSLRKIKELATIIKLKKDIYTSRGMKQFITSFLDTFTQDYLNQITYMIRKLRFEEGTLIQASLSKSLDPCNVILKEYERSFTSKMKVKLSKKVEIKSMDEAANKEFIRLMDLSSRDIYQTLYKACNSMIRFIKNLHLELGFYIGGINLHAALKTKKLPICFPVITDVKNELAYKNLSDVSLGLATKQTIIGNDLGKNANAICMITGANQGGKSTFLRSLGQAFILAQSGLFVGADEFHCYPTSGIFTHFNREEDSSMQSGKLDEELRRMNQLIHFMKPNSTFLFNESFSSTNEREGSKIALDIIKAFVESDTRVFFVTHMYDLSSTILETYQENATFLFASRFPDGTRDFHLKHQEPQRSSYALDLYNNLFDSN